MDKNLKRLILEHIRGSTDKADASKLVDLLTSKFPQFIYQGKAYRAIVIDKIDYNQTLNTQKGTSYTTDTTAIDQFLEDTHFGSNPENIGIVIEAEIIGFNLSQLIIEKSDYFKHSDQDELLSYHDEKEIILIDFLSLVKEYNADPLNY